MWRLKAAIRADSDVINSLDSATQLLPGRCALESDIESRAFNWRRYFPAINAAKLTPYSFMPVKFKVIWYSNLPLQSCS